MSSIKTGDEARDDAQELIEWLVNRLTIDEEAREDDRAQIRWESTLEITVAGRELAAIVERNASLTPVMQALARAEMEGKPTLTYFATKLDEILREMPDKEWRNWTFALPLSIRQLAGDEVDFRVYGQDFAIVSRSKAEQIMGYLLHKQELKRTFNRPDYPRTSPKYYLVAECHGPTRAVAWERLTPAFDTLMGYVEAYLSIGRSQILGNSIRAQLRHPAWMLFRPEEGEIGHTIFVVDRDRKPNMLKLTDEDIRKLREQSGFIREVPKSSSTAALLTDAFRLYHQALNRLHRADCFLGLWQTLEALVFSGEIGADSQKIIQRATWYVRQLDLPGSGMTHLLDALSDKRNDIVHHGVNEITNEDINMLKLVCDAALGWVVNNLDEIPDKAHLRACYEIRAAENQIAAANERLSS